MKWPAAGSGRSERFPARTPLVRSMPALAVLFLLLFALPVAAQDSVLPTLEALRGQYPTPMSEAQLGELLNRVAAQHRFEGWGLHKKDGGQRCPQPQGVSISCDLLVHGPTQNVYDVLVDSTGEARPMFQLVGTINSMANFVAPTVAAEPVPVPVPPSPTPAPVPVPVPPASTDLGPILDLMAGLERQIGILRVENHQDHEATRGQIALLAKQVEGIVLPPLPAEPLPNPGTVVPDSGSALGSAFTFAAKYILPAVVTAIATWQATKAPAVP